MNADAGFPPQADSGFLTTKIIGRRPERVVVPRPGAAAVMAGMGQLRHGRVVARAVPRRRRGMGRRSGTDGRRRGQLAMLNPLQRHGL
jgi:hypothetical protein